MNHDRDHMSGSERRRWQLLLLWWRQQGRCHYCGGWCVLMPPMPKRKAFRDDEATLEHLDTRHSDRRGSYEGTGQFRRVMACRGCNQARGAQDDAWAHQRARELRA